jgi:hypothetical protein
MSERINASICLTDIGEKVRQGHSAVTIGKKNGKKYLNVTIWINDEKDKYDNDVSIQLNSKQESQEAEGKVYVGNGKTNRLSALPSTLAPTMASETDPKDLPF